MSEKLVHDLQGLLAEFQAGGWKSLRVESEGISLFLSHDASDAGLEANATAPVAIHAPAPSPASVAPAAPATTPRAAATDVGIDPAWVAVVAPNLGTFYRSPKPGAAPFVEIGQKVSADTEVCLLEVMKLFTSVKAGVAGTIRHVAAADAELVDGGQVLIYIERE